MAINESHADKLPFLVGTGNTLCVLHCEKYTFGEQIYVQWKLLIHLSIKKGMPFTVREKVLDAAFMAAIYYMDVRVGLMLVWEKGGQLYFVELGYLSYAERIGEKINNFFLENDKWKIWYARWPTYVCNNI